MKITALLYFILAVAAPLLHAAPVHAQVLKKRITVNYQQSTLQEVVEDLQRQARVDFGFTKELKLEELAVKDVNFNNSPLGDVLAALLSPHHIAFNEVAGAIVLSRAQQPGRITIRVVGEQDEPLGGASIRIVELGNSYRAGADGSFSLNVKPGTYTLDVTYLSYQAQHRTGVVVEEGRHITVNFTLQADEGALDEVVVVGYGVQKKINLTGSVSTVDGADLAKRPVMRATSALQGLMPGVTVTQLSGQPGSDGANIRIRGIGTLGNADPLVLIDGVSGNLDGVDPNDIASVSVLKDAASAAIYGARAANGVILVTTKKSGSDTLKLTYNGYVGLQRFTEKPEFVDGYTYMLKMNEAYANMGRTPLYDEAYLGDYLRYKDTDPDTYPDTDWQKELYTGPGMNQHHYVSISGGSKVNVMSSLAYQDQDGLIPNFRSQRYSFRLNARMNIKENLQSTVLLMGRTSPTTVPTNEGNIKNAVNRNPPIYVARLADGRWGVASNGFNPIAQANDGGLVENTSDQFRITAQLNYQPFEGADVELSYSPELRGRDGKTFNRAIETFDPSMETPAFTQPAVSSLVRSNVRTWENTLRLLGRYHKQLGQHGFSVLAGFEQVAFRTDDFRARREGFPLPDYQQLEAGSVVNWSNGGSGSEWSLRSYFGRMNYSWADKYLLEANMRADGSSRFPTGNKYGVFPSVSAGWRISGEDFFDGVGWVSDLKLRASWGRLGNQEIGTYPFSSVIELGRSFVFGGMPADGGSQKLMANEHISWETTETGNLGLDAVMFNNRLSLSGEYYRRNTTGILLQLPVPSIIGLSEPYQNAGVVQNTGWDLAVNYQGHHGSFRYQAGLNLSNVHNEVVDLKGAGPIINGFELIEEGYPINTLFGYQAMGLFQNDEQVSSSPGQFGIYGPGDIRYRDVDGNNAIGAEDRMPIGNPIPRYTFGLTLNAQYKAFDVSVLVQGVGKKDALFNQNVVWALYNNAKIQTWQLDHWTPENTNATYPRLIAETSHNNFQNSSYWVYRSAYARLKNVQLGYTFSNVRNARLPFERLRVYATGDNIFTWSDMPTGWDPERPNGNPSYYPVSSTFLVGLELTF
ncbi:SusC/RagA family TonB-linked outer membrane protein [Parapedobacter deserti]|uniref:SusC/RagA family TonB-linked outer membrane protein n=1 Tax=Parapedobacter deserti TaxID=1912957 RepID=A0ABV7JHX2_9SPHI